MRVKSATCGLLLLFGGLSCPPLAYPEGEMDGAYFKVTYTSTGVSYTNADGILGNGKSTGICYTKLVFDGFGYTGPIACEKAPGVWAITANTFSLDSLGDGAAVGNDNNIAFTNAQGHFISGYSTSVWKPKLNASGVLISAKGTVLGSEACCDSSLDNAASSYIGKLAVTAVTVPAAKVPQAARDLLNAF